LIGLISLNYDDVLDQAYEEFHGAPYYCFSLGRDAASSKLVPLLKLHGSFNWRRQRIRGRLKTIEIIPLGANKTYLHAPYIFIWNRALEILIECDTLRVIGCSLSQDDAHLIDLLFKAHLERDKAFDIEIINGDAAGEGIRKNYGFFPGIRTLTKIEGNLIPEADPPNAFKTWLKYKSITMLGRDVEATRYLRKVVR
jgi:SIR2-like domain